MIERVTEYAEVKALIQTIGEPLSPVRWFHGSLEHGAIIGADSKLLANWRAANKGSKGETKCDA